MSKVFIKSVQYSSNPPIKNNIFKYNKNIISQVEATYIHTYTFIFIFFKLTNVCLLRIRLLIYYKQKPLQGAKETSILNKQFPSTLLLQKICSLFIFDKHFLYKYIENVILLTNLHTSNQGSGKNQIYKRQIIISHSFVGFLWVCFQNR